MGSNVEIWLVEIMLRSTDACRCYTLSDNEHKRVHRRASGTKVIGVVRPQSSVRRATAVFSFLLLKIKSFFFAN